MPIMYTKVVLFFALANRGCAFFIGDNDVSCKQDGSVNIRKSALGNLTSRIYAFDSIEPSGHCNRVVREDVVSFERPRFEESPFRMIIDDMSSDGFHVLDVQCTIRLHVGDGVHHRERREGRKKSPPRDAQGRLVVGPEVNNTGLDSNGNLVRSKQFNVNVGMAVDIPYSDNDEIDIKCQESGQITLSNPDPDIYRFFMGYDSKGKLCTLKVRPDRTWLTVTGCDTDGVVRVAFNNKQFSDGVIGGSSIPKIYRINCAKFVKGFYYYDIEADGKGPDSAYYYIYEYGNSGPGQTGTGKQLLILILTLATVLFLERLTS